jgi:hypothetical protein
MFESSLEPVGVGTQELVPGPLDVDGRPRVGSLAISEKSRLAVDNALSSLISQPRAESKPRQITPKTMSSLGHQDLKNLNEAVLDLAKKTKQEELIKDDDFLEKLVTDIIKKSNVTSKSPSRS